MTVFLNRATELAWLADSWGSGRAELRILYGRRRVGKSALLDEFAAGKRHVLYQAVEGTIADQLRDLTEAILTCQDDPVLRAAPLANWDAAFAYLARMAAERVYQTVVGPALDHFVSKPVFEDVCRAWVLDRVNQGDWPGVDRVGAWWGPIPDPQPGQPRRQTEGEIEVIAAAGKRVILAGEAKWTVEPVGFGVLNHLRQVVRHVPGADDRTELVLFKRSFEPRLVDAAEQERVRLVSLDDLYA